MRDLTERRRDLHALHKGSHFGQHLLGNLHAFLPSCNPAAPSGQRRILSSTASGTDTPGTSLFKNSAFLKLVSGQMPGITGMRQCSIRCRKFFSCTTSKTGWVMANSAPASTFH